MKKVFLGGTCASSTWRENLIPNLKVDYFNPVIPDWTEEAQKEEILQRENCDICLYVITPQMLNDVVIVSPYSIAEVVDDSNKRPEKTVFCYSNYDGMEFESHQLKALKAVGKMVSTNKGTWCENFEDLPELLNS